MSLGDFLRRLASALDGAQIPWMVVGSVAASIHSVPRTTQDADIVVVVDAPRLAALLLRLPAEQWYVSADAAQEAVRTRGMFNVIDLQTGWKADLVVRKNREFSRGEFERRVRISTLGTELWVATPEDTIIAKLEWSRGGESERQLRDVRELIGVQADALDNDYIQRWIGELGLEVAWARVQA